VYTYATAPGISLSVVSAFLAKLIFVSCISNNFVSYLFNNSNPALGLGA